MTSAPPPAVRIAVAIFRIVTGVLPQPFRAAHAQDVQQAFADEALEHYRRGGGWSLLTASVRGLADVLVAAIEMPRRASGPNGLTRDTKGILMNSLWQDIRYALRTLARQPAFTSVAVATLAVGIGATTAVFTFVNAALIRPLPYPDSDRLVRVWGQIVTTGENRTNVNPLDALDWKREAAAFESLGLFTTTTQPLTGAGEPVAIPVVLVTSGFFDTLRATAVQGRLFEADHDGPGRERDVVVTDRFWRGVLGGDPAVLGRTLMLSDVACTIIGVLPSDFVSPGITAASEPLVWRPLIVVPENGRGGHFARSIARLRPDASLADAQAQVNATAERLEREFPATNTGQRARLQSLHAAIAGDLRQGILVLMAAVCVVLLIGCANVANLLLSRATSRQREIAVRGALGASRTRIVRQLLTESLIIAVAAGLIGIGFGVFALNSLPAWLTEQMPMAIGTRVDVGVWIFATGVSMLTALVFGLAPAVHVSRSDLRSAITSGGDRRTTSASGMQKVLLIAETALALVLVTAAILLIQSLVRLQRVDPGFDAEQALTFRVTLPRARYSTSERRAATFEQMTDKVSHVPGVTAAGAVNMSPLSPRASCDSFGLADRPAPPEGQEPCAESRVATREYFAAFGIPVIQGRVFASEDTRDGAPVAIVNETMARKYWPGGTALGQRFKWGSVAAEGPWRTIVGVVGDVKHFGLDADTAPEVYVPLGQGDTSTMTVVARTTRQPASVALDVRSAIRAVDAGLPLAEVFTGRQLVARSTAVQSFRTELLSAFAIVALALAMVGVYGVMAFFVAQRTHELGVRIALGARPGEVTRLVVGRGMAAALTGTVLGLAAAVPLMRLLGGLLFEVSPSDPMPLATAPLLLLLTALVASYLPARRATRVDPIVAIRAE